MSTWTYLIADLLTGAIIDELPLTDVTLSKTLNGSGQFKGSVLLGSSTMGARDVYDLTTPVRRCVYAVRDGTPWWGGIIWTRVYDSSTRKVDIAGADWWSYFDHRKVLELLAPAPWATSYIAGFSKIYTQQDQNVIARGLVQLAQSHTNGNIGITFDSTLSGKLRDRTYDGFDLDYTGAALRDLAAVIDGPDVLFDVAGFDTSGKVVRIMRTGNPLLGQTGAPHRWDLGGNLLSYSWDTGGGVMATRVYAQGDGSDRGTIIAGAEDTSRYADGWPLMETDDIFEGVTEDATLQAHADALLDALALPLTTPGMVVNGDLAPTLSEVSIGDVGRMLIPPGDLFFRNGLDIGVRILTIEVSPGDDGSETIKLAARADQVTV